MLFKPHNNLVAGTVSICSFFPYVFLRKIVLADNCLTVSCWSPPSISMNGPQVHACALLGTLPPSLPPSPPVQAVADRWAELLRHTARSHGLSIFHVGMAMCPRSSLSGPHPLLPTLRPQVCALSLHRHPYLPRALSLAR